MSIGNFSLFLIYLKTKKFLFKEELYVMRFFYKSFRFFLFDLLFFLFYLPLNPYRLCRRFCKKNIYGETPLSTCERIAKEALLSFKDTIFELGAGRGRGAFWFSLFLGCKVVAIECVPMFVRIGHALAFLFDHAPIFKRESFLDTDLSKASVIYLYGTCLEEEDIHCLVKKFSTLSSHVKIITISYPLVHYAPHVFVLQKCFSVTFPWGMTHAYLQSTKNSF